MLRPAWDASPRRALFAQRARKFGDFLVTQQICDVMA
jgi:hypothetical protein